MSLTTPLATFVRIRDYDAQYAQDVHDEAYFGFPVAGILEAERVLRDPRARPIAYFSMEYGLATNTYNVFQSHRPDQPANKLSENDIISNDRISDYLFSLKIDALLDLPIYSGGLGVLAGDTIKTAADHKLPLVAIGILWNKGYFRQRFWFKFGQLPEEMNWDPPTFPGLVPLEDKVKIELKDRDIWLRLWKYYVFNHRRDYAVPLILLDSNVPENDEASRRLTDRLYRSDDLDARLLQRLVLGMGGIKALEALGYPIDLHHLNEGHAAFAFVQKARGVLPADQKSLVEHFVYTCHTPVPAGHDRFNLADVERLMRFDDVATVKQYGLENDATLNLTLLAMNTSRSINAVSQKHGEVMRLQFPKYKERIKAVTNGVHFLTWVSEPVLKVLSQRVDQIGDVREDPTLLARVADLKDDATFRHDIWRAHQESKGRLADLLRKWKIREDVLTIAWARRIAAYKRPSLLFYDIKRLRDLAEKIGPLQILFAGKAHPNDNIGFTYLNDIMRAVDQAGDSDGLLRFIMLENYDTYIAKTLVAGVDIWLNNPLPPYEASGTSGMKAIANGVVQLSTLDGWVIEAADQGIGRFFGHEDDGKSFNEGLVLRFEEDSRALYTSLEEMMRLYYGGRPAEPTAAWVDMMIQCVVQAGRFSTDRMVKEYKAHVWQR